MQVPGPGNFQGEAWASALILGNSEELCMLEPLPWIQAYLPKGPGAS